MKNKIAAFILIIIIFIGGTAYAQQDKYEVHFLDVGQSDCILIKSNNKSYLIDTGAAYYSDRILKYLKENNIEKIDSIILTHYHDDHYGGLLKLVENKKVKNVMLPVHYDKIKYNILKSLAGEKVKVKYIDGKWKLKKGRINLRAIGPMKEDSTIENNNSIVLQGEIDGIRYCFAADCEKEEEEDMIKNNLLEKCDVLKVPHHSLNTSSTEEFIDAVKPKVAVVTSDGVGTPDMKIIERISSRGVAVFRSDLHGNIVIKDEYIKCDKNQLSVKLNRNKGY